MSAKGIKMPVLIKNTVKILPVMAACMDEDFNDFLDQSNPSPILLSTIGMYLWQQ